MFSAKELDYWQTIYFYLTTPQGSFAASDEGNKSDAGKSHEVIEVKDLEDSEEEIEEELEFGNTSIDMTDSNVLASIPCLRGSYVISEKCGERKDKPKEVVKNQEDEDTIVLTFSNSKSFSSRLEGKIWNEL